MKKYICDVCKEEFKEGLKDSISYDLGITNDFGCRIHLNRESEINDMCEDCIKKKLGIVQK